MRLKKNSHEVLVADEKIVRIGRPDIEALQVSFAESARGRSRICAHRGSSEALHEMLIVLARTTYIRPHKHLAKCESFHIIQGELDVVIFDNEGNIADVVQMGEFDSRRYFYYRLVDPLFHTVIVRSESVIFHETTNGPFKREDTVFAPWSPAESGTGAVADYVGRLDDAITKFFAAGGLRT